MMNLIQDPPSVIPSSKAQLNDILEQRTCSPWAAVLALSEIKAFDRA